jgi:succinate-acetate transporter protein
MNKKMTPSALRPFAFVALAVFGGVHRKGEGSLFGHNAPMSYGRFFYVLAFFLIVADPTFLYVLMCR